MSDGSISGNKPESLPVNENLPTGISDLEPTQNTEPPKSYSENSVSELNMASDGVSQQERPYLKSRLSYPHDPVQPRGVSAFSRFRSGPRNRSDASFGHGLELDEEGKNAEIENVQSSYDADLEAQSPEMKTSEQTGETASTGIPRENQETGSYGANSAENAPKEWNDRFSGNPNRGQYGWQQNNTGHFSGQGEHRSYPHENPGMNPNSSFRQRTDRQLSRPGRMMRQNYGGRNYGSRNYGDRNYGDRNYGDRNYGDRNYGDRNYGDRNYGDRNYGDRNYGDRNYGDRNYGDRNYGDRNYGDRNYGDRNYGDRNYGDRNYGDRNYGDRNYGNRNYGDRNYGDRNYGGRNYGRRSYDNGRFSHPYDDQDTDTGIEQTYPAMNSEENRAEIQENSSNERNDRYAGRSGGNFSYGSASYQRDPQSRSRSYPRENGFMSEEDPSGFRSKFGNSSGSRPYHRLHRRNQEGYSTYNPAFPELNEEHSPQEPLSLAEELADEMSRGFKTPSSEGEEVNPTLSLRDESVGHLQKLSMQELIAEARRFEIGVPDDEEHAQRQELIFRIIKEKIKLNGLLYGEGTLEILPDGFGFLRSTEYHYLSCPDDIYVSPSQIRRFGLKTGTIVSGQIRPPKENERYFALLRVEAINYQDPNEFTRKKHFDTLPPAYPVQRMRLESDTSSEEIETRVLDLMVPFAFGQRGLILSPPQTGRTTLLRRIALAAMKNYPELYVFILLIDERPEEVEKMRKQVQGMNCEVVCSTSDEPTMRHIQVADMVIEKAKRMVEYGQNVLILLDSITQLTRAWHSETPPGMKLMPDNSSFRSSSFQLPKRFFSSARCVEEGGSLTIIATILTDTNNIMDEAILEEFQGSGNVEIVLEKRLQMEDIWPAIDLSRSGTRHEDAYRTAEELQAVLKLRRLLSALNPADAMVMLTNRLRKTQTNAEFLTEILNSTNAAAPISGPVADCLETDRSDADGPKTDGPQTNGPDAEADTAAPE